MLAQNDLSETKEELKIASDALTGKVPWRLMVLVLVLVLVVGAGGWCWCGCPSMVVVFMALAGFNAGGDGAAAKCQG